MARPLLPEHCPIRELHGKWSDPSRTSCSQCGWKMPLPEKTPEPRKTFHEGSWRVFTHQGSIGAKCDPPNPEERARWAEEDRAAASDESSEAPTTLQQARMGAQSLAKWRFPAFTEAPPKGTRVYKVVTQRDECFGGQFDPVKLSQRLNDLALDGWRVVSVATADVSTFFGTFWSGRGAREELIAVLEKVVE